MFGIIRPCRNRFGESLRREWTAHLCGMCLALRDEHGHAARLVTNYDALIVSALVDAQSPAPSRRTAGPCALRGMRSASVSDGDGARLAASVSLLLAASKLRDHVEDGDVAGIVRRRATGSVAERFATAGTTTGRSLSLDTVALLDAAAGQHDAERDPATLLEVTAPTEEATAIAFAHTAVLAGRPNDAAPLAEAGRLFGRLAHLLDAVADLADDRARDAWNPITALDLTPRQVRAHCDDAVLGIKLALREIEFRDGRLVHVLLAHEPAAAVRRVFRTAGYPALADPPLTKPLPPEQQPPETGWEAPPSKKGRITGCLASLTACGACEACSRSQDRDDQQREGWCSRVSDCCDEGCCDCCDCCDCCGDSCCDGGCDC